MEERRQVSVEKKVFRKNKKNEKSEILRKKKIKRYIWF
jgi:hypothetical protein